MRAVTGQRNVEIVAKVFFIVDFLENDHVSFLNPVYNIMFESKVP